ncbi:MAG TPA: sulfide/dihydroorotate dehydrogenase-like FAD/NAD-binding protein [Candidatus Omnitrophota bacterium]|nr:sulfide/dihydroorotate dehydrogenase-like FAD/NAD-binding protein [Candidatus Omnitrophota bacterium]
MSYKILSKERLADQIVKMDLFAPEITLNAAAGQFVAIICDDGGERIPLTISDLDRVKGSITIIFQEVGYSTISLGKKAVGESIYAVLGPLGKPTHLEKFGNIICIGGGVGIAEMLPVAKALRDAGNKVTGIIGARSKDLLILEEEIKAVCDELLIATDDGSYGRKGFVTDILLEKLNEGGFPFIYAIGPVPMMKRVADITRPFKIKTVVSLNPLMVDGTGMCGACRCKIEGKTVFGCVDGPEFDAHKVDFDELMKRLSFFKEKETEIKNKIIR